MFSHENVDSMTDLAAFEEYVVHFVSCHGITFKLESETIVWSGRSSRHYAEIIGRFLAMLFRASCPLTGRPARVAPVFKKGNRLSLGNHRLTSLTSCCRLVERIIANRITEYLEENSVFTNCQHGFRKGSSTTIQLLTVIHTFAEVWIMTVKLTPLF